MFSSPPFQTYRGKWRGVTLYIWRTGGALFHGVFRLIWMMNWQARLEDSGPWAGSWCSGSGIWNCEPLSLPKQMPTVYLGQRVWKIHWYLPPSQLPVLASILHKLFVWNRKKPSLTWLVHIKVWLVSQIGIKICRETCCTRAAQSFVGQCRFCISGSLVFEALLMNAEITWLPYFLIFELELSTFLGMLWLRIHLAFEDEPLGSPLVIFHRKGICPTRMKVNFVLGSICGLMQAVIIFVCCFYPW